MGITKTEIFTKDQNTLANLAKVIGHPARVAILQHLVKANHCITGDLVDVIGLAQPTISQHLKELKKLNLIIGNVEGTSVCYCINAKKFEEVKKVFDNFFTQDLNCSC